MKRSALFVLPVGLLLIWGLLSFFKVVDPLFLPSPDDVFKSLISGISSGQLIKSMSVTFARSISGFILAAIIGIPIGLLVGRIPLLARATQPTIDFFRSIPATALFPLFGLRVALSLSFVLIVVTEMFIGTTVGLGYEIMNSQMVYRIPDMYAGIVLTGIVGYLANLSLLKIEKRVLHWVGH
ncbi:MAG: hypothetical protein HY809_01530 [Nitrospirae bacterium]|nr:hypothetical protein [Nitrospirota bacterium]